MSPEALRVPPHSIEAEQSVIGALLLDNRVFDKLGELRADEFYNAGHQRIFEAMHAAWVAGQTFDAVTVSEALKATDKLEFYVGGLAYIGALQNAQSQTRPMLPGMRDRPRASEAAWIGRCRRGSLGA